MKLLIIACLISCFAYAQEEEHRFGTVKKIDLSDDKPDSPNHLIVKFGALGNVVLYQFSNRVRIDFEGRLGKGEYILAVADKCTKTYGRSWTELNRFKSEGNDVVNEKSLPKASLREAKPGNVVLMDKVLGLFRVKGGSRAYVDCRAVK